MNISLNAQSYTQRQEFSVMNPTSFEMSRFELTPINQYTGKANVNFPLCGISIDDKELSLNLSYDTGGVRVAQEASWVGLGWNLGGIPIITHQINQRSDIGNKAHPDTGYCFEPALPQSVLTAEYFNQTVNSGVPYGQPDTQPDLFVANLMGSTVKFQLTQKATTTTIDAVILNESNALIEYLESSQTFKLTDEEGYIYHFSEIEYATTWTEPGGNPLQEFNSNDINGAPGNPDVVYREEFEESIPTAWYVDKIVSPHGEILEFTYDYQANGQPNVTVSHPSYHSNATVSICGFEDNNGNIGQDFKVSPLFENVTASRTIQEVKVLSNIENITTGDKLVFNVDERLDLHPYNSTYLGGSVFGFGVADGTPKKLSSIQLESASNVVKTITFQHSYFNEFRSSQEDAVDYLRLKLDGFKIFDQQYAFKYKCDDALPVKHSKSTDFWGYYNGQTNAWRIPYVKLDFEGLCSIGNANYFNEDLELSTGAIKGSSFCDALIGSLEEIRYPTGGTTEFEYGPNEISIDVNDSELNADDFNYSYLAMHNIEVDYPKEGTLNPNVKTFAVGGLRIARVVNKDSNGASLLRKSYRYTQTLPNGEEVSSGKLMDALDFFRRSLFTNQNSNVWIDNLNINSNNLFGTNNSAMGSFLGYGQVEEVLDSKDGSSDIGRIVSNYINLPNQSLFNDSDGYLYAAETTPVNYEDANGKLTHQYVYDRFNNPKQSSEFRYTANPSPFSNLPGYKVYYSSLDNDGIINNNIVTDSYRYLASRSVRLVYQSSITENLEGESVEKITRNEYNGYSMIISSNQTTSKTSTIDAELNLEPSEAYKTEYYYPYDSDYGVNSSSISADLITKNIISQPIYTRSYFNDNLISHQLTKFQIKNGNMTKPEGVYFSKDEKSLSEIENRVKYEEYDSYGNLTQYKQANGITVAALWGYNGKYMVAKVENTTYNQLLSVLGISDSSELGSSGLDDTQKNNISGIPNVMASFYDYEPLVGITKTTDPREYETTYLYDDFNRLKEVRDEANNILEDYEYNFVDVPLYPQSGFSECYDSLLIGQIEVLYSRPQYFTIRVNPTGGFGDYSIQWSISEDLNKRTAQFGSILSNTDSFNYEICCDQQILIKVVVSDGTQTKSTIIKNPNYNIEECIEGACSNPN